MDIRGITFSIEALPIRKGLPLFLFTTKYSPARYLIAKNLASFHFLNEFCIYFLSCDHNLIALSRNI